MIIENQGDKGGVGYLIGQSFLVDSNASISTITLAVCDGVDAQIVVREASTGDWNAGEIVGTSQIIEATSGSGSYCSVSQYGSSHYPSSIFVFDDLNVEAGGEYIIELTTGLAISSANSFAEGSAFSSG